jgi:hypothetical protein
MDFVADGVKLTPGGRLPRTVVRSMQQHRPHWYPLDRPASIEDDLPPLGALHDLMRRVGLLRLSRGVLTPTRAASDDLAVVRRLRTAFDAHSFSTEITELTIGVLAAHGPLPLSELAARVLPLLEYGWQLDGQSLTADDVRSAIARQSPILNGLDLIDHADWRVWALGPAALSLLPGATRLAEIWTNE